MPVKPKKATEPATAPEAKPAASSAPERLEGLEAQLASLAHKVDLLIVALALAAPQAMGAALQGPTPARLNGVGTLNGEAPILG